MDIFHHLIWTHFFDDDGRVYVFSGQERLNELTADLKSMREGGLDTTVIERDVEETGLLEGSRVIKHDGKYYLITISALRSQIRDFFAKMESIDSQ